MRGCGTTRARWSATTGDLIGYESLLERDRLMLADFDRDVVAIASQPFGITGDVGGSTRRHVPDYLLRLVDGAVVAVDAKLAGLGVDTDAAVVAGVDGRPRCPGVGDDQDRADQQRGPMATGVLEVRVGTRLWLDGQVWTVCEVPIVTQGWVGRA